MDDKFWEKSNDAVPGGAHPDGWEASCVEAIQSTFQEYQAKTAIAYMGVDISFEELDLYSNRFAQMLVANGLKNGDVIAINLPNIPENIIAWLGVLKAGCVVSGMSPRLSIEEMEYQLSDSGARGLVTQDALFAERRVHIESNLPELRVVVTANVGGFLPGIKKMIGKLLGRIPKGKVTPLEGKKTYKIEEVIKTKAFASSRPAVNTVPGDVAYLHYESGMAEPLKEAILSHGSAVSDLLIERAWSGWQKGEKLTLSDFPVFNDNREHSCS